MTIVGHVNPDGTDVDEPVGMPPVVVTDFDNVHVIAISGNDVVDNGDGTFTVALD